jgi:hypothetical protein
MKYTCTAFILILVSITGCSGKKDIPISSPNWVSPIERIFPLPYFPEKKTVLLGMPLSTFSRNWVAACIYSENIMNSKQLKLFKSLSPMEDKGIWGTYFERDFDGDGNNETVNYGAYQNANDEIGNFLLITRRVKDKVKILLMREFKDEAGHFACFYLIYKNNSIMFGSRLIDSELSYLLEWQNNEPILIDMDMERLSE